MDRPKCVEELEYANSRRTDLGVLSILPPVRDTRQPKLARQEARGSFGRKKRICVDRVWNLRAERRPDAQ
jgi:hypothetical protein